MTLAIKENNKGKYIADLLQNDVKIIYINIHLPPSYKGLGCWAAEVCFPIKGGKQINAVKKSISKIKLNSFDFDAKTIEEKTEFYLSDACPELGLHIEFCDGSFMLMYINERLKDSLGANISVQYKSKNRTYKYYTALICDEAKKSLIDLANNMFDEFLKNCL